jgi:hypothetical protein
MASLEKTFSIVRDFFNLDALSLLQALRSYRYNILFSIELQSSRDLVHMNSVLGHFLHFFKVFFNSLW